MTVVLILRQAMEVMVVMMVVKKAAVEDAGRR